MSEMSGHAGWLDGLLLLVPGFLNDSGLFGEHHGNIVANRVNAPARNAFQSGLVRKEFHPRFAQRANQDVESKFWNTQEDRKSTRLNSSHVAISYAAFCLKKKTKFG